MAPAGGQGLQAVAPAYGKLLRASRSTLKAGRGVEGRAGRTHQQVLEPTSRRCSRAAGSGHSTSRPERVLEEPADFLEIAEAVRKVLRRNGHKAHPIWVTEFTAPAAKGRIAVPEYQSGSSRPTGGWRRS